MDSELALAVLPADHADDRVLLVLCRPAGPASFVELRQQSWSDAVGWFTQATVRLEPQQVALLKAALGKSSLPTPAGRSPSVATAGEFSPRLFQAESA